MSSDELPSKRLKYCLNFEPILSANIFKPVESIDLCVLHLQDKRNVPQLLKILPELPSFLSHIKRINDGRMIVHGESGFPTGSLLDEIHKIEGSSPIFSLVSVPRNKPKVRRQFEEAKRMWPTAFHEDKKLEALLNGTYFSETEQERMATIFFRAQEIGGCVVYDPNGEIIVTESAGHPEMPNGHPVIYAVNFVCEEARKNGSNKKSAQYLATGYDFYLNSEPCAMCAMAMVHMRVGRVFFGELNPKSGALSSHCQLHLKPEINHHYEVFRITMENL